MAFSVLFAEISLFILRRKLWGQRIKGPMQRWKATAAFLRKRLGSEADQSRKWRQDQPRKPSTQRTGERMDLNMAVCGLQGS
jgi:hypothetical protein